MHPNYKFEPVTSRKGYHAEKIMSGGKHLATLLHLNHNKPSDWRIFRQADWRQIQPWEIFTMDSLDEAKSIIQTMDQAVFEIAVDRTYVIECLTSYGEKQYIHIGDEGYPTLRRLPGFMSWDEAYALCNDYETKPQPIVIGSMTGGDYVIQMQLVRLGAVSDMPPICFDQA